MMEGRGEGPTLINRINFFDSVPSGGSLPLQNTHNLFPFTRPLARLAARK